MTRKYAENIIAIAWIVSLVGIIGAILQPYVNQAIDTGVLMNYMPWLFFLVSFTWTIHSRQSWLRSRNDRLCGKPELQGGARERQVHGINLPFSLSIKS